MENRLRLTRSIPCCDSNGKKWCRAPQQAGTGKKRLR